MVVLNGAGDPFFYGGVVGGGSMVGGSVWGGCGSVAIKSYLNGGERWDFREIGGVAVWDVVASEVEVVATGGGDGLDEVGFLVVLGEGFEEEGIGETGAFVTQIAGCVVDSLSVNSVGEFGDVATHHHHSPPPTDAVHTVNLLAAHIFPKLKLRLYLHEGHTGFPLCPCESRTRFLMMFHLPLCLAHLWIFFWNEMTVTSFHGLGPSSPIPICASQSHPLHCILRLQAWQPVSHCATQYLGSWNSVNSCCFRPQ